MIVLLYLLLLFSVLVRGVLVCVRVLLVRVLVRVCVCARVFDIGDDRGGTRVIISCCVFVRLLAVILECAIVDVRVAVAVIGGVVVVVAVVVACFCG